MSELKKCPFCGEMINAAAIKCRYCREMLDEKNPASTQAESSASAAKSGTSEPPAETPQAPAPGAEEKTSSDPGRNTAAPEEKSSSLPAPTPVPDASGKPPAAPAPDAGVFPTPGQKIGRVAGDAAGKAAAVIIDGSIFLRHKVENLIEETKQRGVGNVVSDIGKKLAGKTPAASSVPPQMPSAGAESASAGPAGLQTSAEDKICPFCGETIKAAATKCRYCHETLIHDAGANSGNGSTVNGPFTLPGGFTFTRGIVAWGISGLFLWWAFGSFNRFMSFFPPETRFDSRFKAFTDVLEHPEISDGFLGRVTGISSLPSPKVIIAALIIGIGACILACFWRWKENRQHVHIEVNCWLIFQMLLSLLYPWAGFCYVWLLSFMAWPIIIFVVVAVDRKAKVVWTILLLVLEFPMLGLMIHILGR